MNNQTKTVSVNHLDTKTEAIVRHVEVENILLPSCLKERTGN